MSASPEAGVAPSAQTEKSVPKLELFREPLPSKQRQQQMIVRAATARVAEQTTAKIGESKEGKPANDVEGELQTLHALTVASGKEGTAQFPSALSFKEGSGAALYVVEDETAEGKKFYRHKQEGDDPSRLKRITSVIGVENGWFGVRFDGKNGGVEDFIDASLVLDLQTEAVTVTLEAELKKNPPPEGLDTLMPESVKKVSEAYFTYQNNPNKPPPDVDTSVMAEAEKASSIVTVEESKTMIDSFIKEVEVKKDDNGVDIPLTAEQEAQNKQRQEILDRIESKGYVDGADLTEIFQAAGGDPEKMALQVQTEVAKLTEEYNLRVQELSTLMKGGHDTATTELQIKKLEAEIKSKSHLQNFLAENSEQIQAQYGDFFTRLQEGRIPSERSQTIKEALLSADDKTAEKVLTEIVIQMQEDTPLNPDQIDYLNLLIKAGGLIAAITAFIVAMDAKQAVEGEVLEKKQGFG